MARKDNIYECLLLLDTTKLAGDQATAVAQLHATMEKHHAKVLASRPWDDRRLAYPIKGQKKGLFYLLYFEAPGKAVVGIEADFKLNETILRHMILHIETKWVETMLALARDEHALALQAVVEDPMDLSGGRDDMMGGGRERRGRRDDKD